MRQLEGGGREIDVRQLERNGWRKCGSGCVLPVVSGFFTRCGAATPYPCEALYTPKVLSAKLRKNLETYEL